MKMNDLFRVGGLAGLLCCTLLVSACEEDGDPKSISGPALLRVENKSDYDIEVDFDGDYVGRVTDGFSRQWDVPAGVHRVRVGGDYGWADDYGWGNGYDDEYSTVDEDFVFVSGEAVFISTDDYR